MFFYSTPLSSNILSPFKSNSIFWLIITFIHLILINFVSRSVKSTRKFILTINSVPIRFNWENAMHCDIYYTLLSMYFISFRRLSTYFSATFLSLCFGTKQTDLLTLWRLNTDKWNPSPFLQRFWICLYKPGVSSTFIARNILATYWNFEHLFHHLIIQLKLFA